MQAQSILNTKSNVGFQSKDKLEKASRFVNMSDAQLQLLAYNATVDKKRDKKDQKTIFGMFCAMPIIDTIASGVLAKRVLINQKTGIVKLANTTLSDKLLAAGVRGSNWILGLGLVSVYSVIKKEIASNSPGVNNFEKNHPILSFLTDIGIVMGGFLLGLKGIDKFADRTVEKHPEAVKRMGQKILNACKKVDDTAFNKVTLPKMSQNLSKFAEEAPFLAKAGRFALVNSVWILLGAALIKMVKVTSDNRDKVEQNFQLLKTAQLQTAKHLVNTLNVERDVLAQDQPELAADMRKTMNGKKPVSNKEMREIRKQSEIYEDEKLRMQIRENLEAKEAEQTEQIEQPEQSEQINQPKKQAMTEIIYIAKIENNADQPKEESEE